MSKEDSRRQFLKILGAGAGGALTWYLKGKLDTGDPLIRLPDAPPAHKSLEATAVAVTEQGKTTSFVPEGEFTEEYYNRVRNSTFAIDILSDEKGFSGTSWCARKDGNIVYLVTNRHAFRKDDEHKAMPVKDIFFWRPHTDKKVFAPQKFAFVTSEERDLAVIRCELPPQEAEHLQPLPFEDKAAITKGQQLLDVSFPLEFRQKATDGRSFPTAAQVITVESGNIDQKLWVARGKENYSSSGSPLTLPDTSGTPVVIGIFKASAYMILNDNWAVGRKQPTMLCETLDLAPLMEEVDNTAAKKE